MASNDNLNKSYQVASEYQQVTEQNIEKNSEKRKRSRNPENWIKTKRKQAIIAGQSYVNTKGEIVSSKFIGPDCNCKNKCFLGVNKENREIIFKGFYSLKR